MYLSIGRKYGALPFVKFWVTLTSTRLGLFRDYDEIVK